MKPGSTAIIIRFGMYLFFLLPILFFLLYFKPELKLNAAETLSALQTSLFQSLSAAVICIAAGILMSFGLFSLKTKKLAFVKYLLLLPQVLPVFFLVLIMFSLINPFPLGHSGVIILFVFINLGLAALLIYQAQLSAIGRYAPTAELFGISSRTFYSKIWWPLMRGNLFNIGLLIFVFCFTSFSIPILAGDGRSANFEILIFEKIYIESDWSAAISLCVLQMGFIYFLSFLNRGNFEDSQISQPEFRSKYISLVWMSVPIAIYLLLYIGGYAIGLMKSFMHIDFLIQYRQDFIKALFFTLKANFYFCVLNLALLTFWFYDFIKHKKQHPIMGFMSLSTLIVGFSFYMVFSFNPKTETLKLVLASSLLFFIPLYKLFLEKPVAQLQKQITIAQLYGVPTYRIIIDVIFRQLSKRVFLWLAVMSLWFMCDYAVSKAVGLQTPSLGTQAASFLSSYRLDFAYLLTFIILLTHLTFFIIFYFILKVLNVAYQKIRI